MKIAITGGHHNSALVVADDLLAKKYKVVWLGHKYASYKDINESAEFIEVGLRKIPFYNLSAGKISSSHKLINILKLPYGLLQSLKILKKEKPNLILSFGGYLGATASLAAWILKIPIFIHEQTAVAGRANKFSSRFADKVFISWKQSAKYYPPHKTIYSGLPLRKSILNPTKKSLFNNQKKTILILGGKRGSHIINKYIFKVLPELLVKYNVIHQTGTYSVTGDYKAACSLKDSLDPELSYSYKPLGYITEDEIGDYIYNSHLVISRSGAHTVYELAILSKPCILIPFEHTHMKEQLVNAKILEKNGQSLIIRENALSSKSLLNGIGFFDKNNIRIANAKLPQNANKIITSEIISFIK